MNRKCIELVVWGISLSLACAGCTGLVVGNNDNERTVTSQETSLDPYVSAPVLSAAQADLDDMIDAPLVAVSKGAETRWILSNCSRHHMFSGPSSALTKTHVWNKKTDELFKDNNSEDGRWWIVNAYQVENEVLAFVHVECAEQGISFDDDCAGFCGDAETGVGKSRIGLAWSSDHGETFKFLGNVLEPYNDPMDQNIQGAPYLVKDGYFYLYYHDNGSLSVARAPVDEVLDAARSGETTSWKKLYDNTFTEEGLGGKYQSLGIVGISHSDAVYSTSTDKYYMALSRLTGGAWGDDPTEIALYASDDVINWTQVASIVEEPKRGSTEDYGYQYISIVNAYDANNNNVTDGRFHIISGKQVWQSNAAIYRWTVDLGDGERYTTTAPSEAQGQDGWTYQYSTAAGSYDEMLWNGSYWQGSEEYARIGNDLLHPGKDEDVVLSWEAPKSGSIVLSGTLFDADDGCGDGVTGTILLNEELLWVASIENGDIIGTSHLIATGVSQGDTLRFVLSSKGDNYCDNTAWTPTIEFIDNSWDAVSQFTSAQNSGGFNYLFGEPGSTSSMTYDETAQRWVGDETYSIIGMGWMHPGESSSSILSWTAPYSGNLRITGTVADGDGSCGDGVQARVLVNGEAISEASYLDVRNGETVEHEIWVLVQSGDDVQFVVDKNGNSYCDSTSWNPTIKYY